MLETGSVTPDGPELLVPFDASDGAEKVLRRACRVARRDAVPLSVLCLVKLPADDPDAWDDPRLDETALLALAHAQEICREEGVVASFELSHARNVAQAIVEEARRDGAALICLSLRDHEDGTSVLMSQTVQSVLAAAPCSVLLSDPERDLLRAASGR